MTSPKRRQIALGLKSKGARKQFIEAEIDVSVPMQIFSMRKARKWTQTELGKRADMAQARISVIEKPGTGDLNLSTLKALASAFDVGLMVRFVPLSAQVDLAANLSLADISPPSYSDDETLRAYETESASYSTPLPRSLYVMKTHTNAPEEVASDEVA